MSRQEVMQYLEKNFDERVLMQLEKRFIPQLAIDEHNKFLKWRAAQPRPAERYPYNTAASYTRKKAMIDQCIGIQGDVYTFIQ